MGLRRVALGLAAALGGVGGCALDDGAPLAAGGQAIVAGAPDAGDPAVVALLYLGQQYCTGTVVSPRVVVTAAHCLPPHIGFSLADLQIYVGDDVTEAGASFGAVEAVAHPDWSPDVVANDLGLVALDGEVAVTAAAVLRPAEAVRVGERVRMVGFGITSVDALDNGIKRAGQAAVGAVSPSTIHLEADPSLTCNGDSGGPMFVERDGAPVFAGIHSRSDCAATFLNERIDVHLADEVAPFVARYADGACGADGTCDEDCGLDPDCGDLGPGTIAIPRPIQGGCAAGGGAAGGGPFVALLAALAAALATGPAGRRRRSGRRRRAA